MMLRPFGEDYSCPYCEKGTMKWQAELFASTYQLGRWYCDNPDCFEHREKVYDLKALIKAINKPEVSHE